MNLYYTDTPCLLVNMMQRKPWIRRNEKGRNKIYFSTFFQELCMMSTGDTERYGDRWVPVETSERLKISKVEGQVWLALYQLLLSEPCQQKYEFTDHNKSTLLKVWHYDDIICIIGCLATNLLRLVRKMWMDLVNFWEKGAHCFHSSFSS